MNTLLITLADFPDFVPFSINIAGLLVKPHIRDAQTFDVWPVLPVAARTDLEAPAANWSDATKALFGAFVRPLLVCEAARRMLLWHGAHVTPAGLETISEMGHAPVSGATRTELRADLQAKCAYWRARLETAVAAAYPRAGTTSCTTSRSRRAGHGGLHISAV